LFRTQSLLGKACWKLLKPLASSRGYDAYTLSKQGTVTNKKGHRLVWEAFNGPIPKDMTINHKNGNKKDNRLANLEVVSQAENTEHAIVVLDSYYKGEQVHIAKLTEKEIPEICRLYANGGISQRALAAKYNVTCATIHDVLHNVTWRHVSR
jgi:hypothetical protein